MVKTEVKKSKIHGLGVFALEDIAKGTVIEVCYMIPFPKKDIALIKKTFLNNYYFEWLNGGGAVALGNGSIYNHSYEPNAEYLGNEKKNITKFVAIKPIKKGQEIFTSYNGDAKRKEKVWFDK
ncbi:MAG: SET domain-containing protein [Patescibacteria group bacterium]